MSFGEIGAVKLIVFDVKSLFVGSGFIDLRRPGALHLIFFSIRILDSSSLCRR